MTPFSGFMQAVDGLVPGFGDKPGNIGKGIHGLSGGDDTRLPTDEHTRSFLAWVQNFMDNAAGTDDDGESAFNFQPSDLDPDLPILDQLQALMADAKDQFSQDQPSAHARSGGSLDNGHVPFPQGIINAIITYHQRSQVADIPTLEGLPDNPEMLVSKEHTPAVGQTHAADKGPQFQAAASGVPAQSGKASERQIKADTPAFGQPKPATSGVPAQSGKASERQIKADTPAFGQPKPATSGIPAPVGKVDDNQIKDRSPELMIKANRPEEGFEKADARFSFKPPVPAGEAGQASTNRMIQERLPSGPGTAGKAEDPASPPPPSVAGQTKDPESMLTGLLGQGSAHPEDDTADFRGKDPHHRAQRVEPVDVKEEVWQKSQTSDAAKSTAAEQTKSHPSFQEPAKAMAGDPPKHMAIKPAAGQAATLTRTEDAAVKTFQTAVMDQIVDKAAMRSIHGRSEVQIRLKPEFLGKVQMNIAADKEQLVVRIITDRPVVKEIIETHLHHLRTELQNQGLTIDKFEVMVDPDGNQHQSREQFAGMFKHHFSQNGRRQQHEQDPETLNRDGGNNPDDVQPSRDGVNYFA